MNIIILNPFNKFPGSERWDFELINYEAFIDHSLHRVTYIADQRGLSGITADPESYHLIKISNFNEEEQLAQILEDEIQRLGKVDRIIAFSENHMDLVAQLREKHEIPGPGIAETERARDKVVMKQCLEQANLRVPYYLHLEPNMSQEKIAEFVAKVGFPLIFKPTNGASSVGVQKIEDEAQLQSALRLVDSEFWELEEFVAGRVLHVDGILNAQGDAVFSIPSVYINTLFDYLRGVPTGSYLLKQSDPLYHDAVQFSAKCLKALKLYSCPFHLELIVTENNELVFLENAARVAGADIPYMIADCTGVNLFRAWVEMIMGNEPNLTQSEHQSGGWLLFGLPPVLPVKVINATRFLGKVTTLYKELVPEPDSVVTKPRGYCALQAGRFLFRGQDFDEMRASMDYVLNNFDFNAQEVTAS